MLVKDLAEILGRPVAAFFGYFIYLEVCVGQEPDSVADPQMCQVFIDRLLSLLLEEDAEPAGAEGSMF